MGGLLSESSYCLIPSDYLKYVESIEERRTSISPRTPHIQPHNPCAHTPLSRSWRTYICSCCRITLITFKVFIAVVALGQSHILVSSGITEGDAQVDTLPLASFPFRSSFTFLFCSIFSKTSKPIFVCVELKVVAVIGVLYLYSFLRC